jgi:hypothetical protein
MGAEILAGAFALNARVAYDGETMLYLQDATEPGSGPKVAAPRLTEPAA